MDYKILYIEQTIVQPHWKKSRRVPVFINIVKNFPQIVMLTWIMKYLSNNKLKTKYTNQNT